MKLRCSRTFEVQFGSSSINTFIFLLLIVWKHWFLIPKIALKTYMSFSWLFILISSPLLVQFFDGFFSILFLIFLLSLPLWRHIAMIFITLVNWWKCEIRNEIVYFFTTSLPFLHFWRKIAHKIRANKVKSDISGGLHSEVTHYSLFLH